MAIKLILKFIAIYRNNLDKEIKILFSDEIPRLIIKENI